MFARWFGMALSASAGFWFAGLNFTSLPALG
jgi:hypothetical protein